MTDKIVGLEGKYVYYLLTYIPINRILQSLCTKICWQNSVEMIYNHLNIIKIIQNQYKIDILEIAL